MKTYLRPKATSMAGMTLCAALFAFKQENPPVPPAPAIIDTVPAPKNPVPPTPPPNLPRMADFEDAHKQLQQTDAQLKKAQRQIEVPEPPQPPTIDNQAIEKALKAIDWDKVEADIARNMEALKKAQAEITKADVKAMRSEIEASMKEAREQIAIHKQLDIEQMQAEIREMKPRIEAEMKRTQTELAKAKEERRAFETFVNDLAADGLIDKTAYTIEHKDKALYINGKQQPEAIYNKYQAFLEKQQIIKITKSDEGFQIKKQ